MKNISYIALALLPVLFVGIIGMKSKETTEDDSAMNTESTSTIISYTGDTTDQYTEISDTIIQGTKDDPVTIAPSYTEEDLFNLAAAVCREAGGESEEIQLLVANVVINRVEHPDFADTIEGVLTSYMQYGMMWKYGISFPDWADQETIDQCYSVAKRILEGERVCPPSVVYQAEFRQGSGVFKEFDGFYFCYKE